MFLFSFIFLGIGILFELAGIGFIIAMATGMMDFNFFFILGFAVMPVLFIVIGAVSLSKCLKERKELKDIAKNGRTTYAKVVGIKDTAGIIVNGMRPHGISIRYFDAQGRINNDMIKIDADQPHYDTISVGETLEISELNGKCIILRELENLPFEGSEMLIDMTVSVYGEGETTGVTCPSCGGQVNVAKGRAAFCSHCGYKIRLSEDGKIENPS